jgi:hypothetical protein
MTTPDSAPSDPDRRYPVLVDIEPRVRARVQVLIDQVGEAEFRRGVEQFTGWWTGSQRMTLDEVVTLYVMTRRGQLKPRRAIKILMVATLPGDPDVHEGITTDSR